MGPGICHEGSAAIRQAQKAAEVLEVIGEG
jgi:hypothetical protein